MRFDIKTVSEANQREHWAVKARRKREQQRDFSIYWKVFRRVVELPATITFTRHACNTLDSDNLAGAFKHVRDQLARELNVDDGTELITWKYAQEKTPKREHYFTLDISSAD